MTSIVRITTRSRHGVAAEVNAFVEKSLGAEVIVEMNLMPCSLRKTNGSSQSRALGLESSHRPVYSIAAYRR
jgi:hypothetical protein